MVVRFDLQALAAVLGPRALQGEPLARHTAMRVGGPADLLIVCERVEQVVDAVSAARLQGVPWLVLGGGCNVLASDAGVRGLVIINRAARIEFKEDPAFEDTGGRVRAEAGAQLSTLSREVVERGLAGLEWAAGLPGTVGGAVTGNAGAFDGDIASTLHSAVLLEPHGEVVERSADWFQFDYRTSRIKRSGSEAGGRPIVLSALFELRSDDPETLTNRAAEILEWRQTRHPSGATMGSTFKNPPGSHAGFLIEQAGLRGHRIGGARISEQHGNFFMNVGEATAENVLALIDHAREEVDRQFGVQMELEVELIGWQTDASIEGR